MAEMIASFAFPPESERQAVLASFQKALAAAQAERVQGSWLPSPYGQEGQGPTGVCKYR